MHLISPSIVDGGVGGCGGELARCCVGADDWVKKRTNYAARLGASSVANYLLGLGDRHLENVLLDGRDGAIVDVDWGVCFGAGTRLRVPERVPFRLTRMLVRAMGAAGVEGASSPPPRAPNLARR